MFMHSLPALIKDKLLSYGIKDLRPGQQKALDAGLLDNKSMLICTPTASGKTIIAEMAFMDHIHNSKGKVVYIVPLKALANEKYKDFKAKYSFKIALSIGDLDAVDSHLADYDLIICTSEKLDSLLRHHAPWLSQVSLLVIDEIHLLNDTSRGPTLEIILTIIRRQLKHVQIVGLSATIGNPEELASWLDAALVLDDWRPVELRKGVYHDSQIEFFS